MKRSALFLIVLLSFSCKENTKVGMDNTTALESTKLREIKYPEALVKVLEAHGGLASWRSYKTLAYSIPKDPVEKQTIDLYSRKDKIVNGAVEMGFDGKDVWLLDQENTYKGDPIFYHNLMFYFYAMPFVLADNGIIYSDTEPLVYEDKSYPGIKISYEDGVGTSSKDDYYLYYDSETYQMAWLGYTVTYRSGEKSDKISYIRYKDWVKVEEVILPNAITWHVYEDGMLKEARNTVYFEHISLSKNTQPVAFYATPPKAKVVTGEQE